MKTDVWPLHEAKSRFSELVETAMRKGVQTVTKHGKPAVVVMSAEDYRRTGPGRSLATAVRACPEDLTPLVGKRSRQRGSYGIDAPPGSRSWR